MPGVCGMFFGFFIGFKYIFIAGKLQKCYFFGVNANSQKLLLEKSAHYMRFVRLCPFVRLAAVCNNVAMARAHENSDIDLFFVIKKDRLFTGRFLVTLLFHLFGVRRHGSKISTRFCLSFFIDEDELNLEKIAIQNDYYLAYWLKTLVPFIDNGTLSELENQNKWVPDLKITRNYLIPSKVSFLEKLFPSFLERFLASWQKKRALKKMNTLPRPHGVIVTDHMLKFHDVDKRELLREEMKSISGISF
jgi:hypothetical protein